MTKTGPIEWPTFHAYNSEHLIWPSTPRTALGEAVAFVELLLKLESGETPFTTEIMGKYPDPRWQEAIIRAIINRRVNSI